jgi:N-acetylmuramoyl-L-alanine amidase
MDGSEERERPRGSWAPRIVAPLVFFAAATILVVLVNSALDRGSEEANPTPPPPSVATGPTVTGENPDGENVPPRQRQFHRIRPGDTLEAVANRYETTVDDLLRLNPNIEPNNLSPGQRIRVR